MLCRLTKGSFRLVVIFYEFAVAQCDAAKSGFFLAFVIQPSIAGRSDLQRSMNGS